MRPRRLAAFAAVAFVVGIIFWIVFLLGSAYVPASSTRLEWIAWTAYFLSLLLTVIVGPALLVAAAVVAWRRSRHG